MYVPATLAQPATALSPLVIDASGDTAAAGAGAHLAERAPRRAERARGPHDERHRQAHGAHGRPQPQFGVPRRRRDHGIRTASATPRRRRSTPPAWRDRRCSCRRSASTAGGRWRTRAPARTAASGCATSRVRPPASRCGCGSRGDAEDLPAHRRLGALNVYRLAEASWYGGGGELACGGELTSATMGVANKTLPCGTRGDAPLRRAHGARRGDRPRTVRGRTRIRPHRSDEAGARVRRRRRGMEHALSVPELAEPRSAWEDQRFAWEPSCRGWLSVECVIESAECQRE